VRLECPDIWGAAEKFVGKIELSHGPGEIMFLFVDFSQNQVSFGEVRIHLDCAVKVLHCLFRFLGTVEDFAGIGVDDQGERI